MTYNLFWSCNAKTEYRYGTSGNNRNKGRETQRRQAERKFFEETMPKDLGFHIANVAEIPKTTKEKGDAEEPDRQG